MLRVDNAEGAVMAHDPRLLQAMLTAAAPTELDIVFRPMFGGLFAYTDGKPFASPSDVGLAIKLVGRERDAMLALPGAAPLRYQSDDPPSQSYVLVPETMLLEPDQFRPWLVRCVTNLPPERPRNRT